MKVIQNIWRMPENCGVIVVNSPIPSDQGCMFLAMGVLVHTAFFFSQGDILAWKGLTSHQGRKTSSEISLVASGHGDKDMLYGFVCKIYAPKGYHKPKPPTLKERFGWHKSLN